ncbi:MAG: hypothetical protein H6730_38320 [Deltaproteobacteria bacterium]|nr:hypothetical protein [Deltaproteobacteria bacterium]
MGSAPALLLLALAQAPADVRAADPAEDPFDALYQEGAKAPEPDAPGGPRLAPPPPAAPAPAPVPVPVVAPVVPPVAASGPVVPPIAHVGQVPQRWYRWPILIADAGLMVVAGVGFALEDTTVAAVGSLGFAFTAPTIHWLEGNQRGGLFSLLLHAGGPAAVGLLGALIGATEGGENETTLFFVGAGLGAVTATILDLTVFGHVDAPAAPLTVAPVLSTDGERTMVGLGGTF